MNKKMNTRKMTFIGLLAVLAISIGGVGFVLAQSEEAVTYPCEGDGPVGLLMGRGFWSQLTEEQRAELLTLSQEMMELGATPEEIREMKATMLDEWGIEAPLWSGPHYGEQGQGGYGGRRGGRGYGKMSRGGRYATTG